jgi:DNA-binding Xre family transcriptional regulator
MFRKLLNDLEEYDKKPTGMDLRLDLAEIILRRLDGKRRTQAKLAAATGMSSEQLRLILDAAKNCTFETADRLGRALGLRLRLVPVKRLAKQKGPTNVRTRQKEREVDV